MKSILKKSVFALLIILFVLSIASICAFATETETETATEEVFEDVIVIKAEEMQGYISNPHKTTEFSFIEEDGKTLLRIFVIEESVDPFVTFDPAFTPSADEYKYIGVVVRANAPKRNFSIYYSTEGNLNYSENGVVKNLYANVDGWQMIGMDLSKNETWTGDIYKIRLDCLEYGKFPQGSYCDISHVVFAKTAEDLYEVTNQIFQEIYAPEQILSDFTEDDIRHFNKATISTDVSARNGNLLFSATGTKDPQAKFSYTDYAAAHGIDKLTTDDFRYTVIRYRTSAKFGSTGMELFIFTGDQLGPMLRINNTYVGHSGDTDYKASADWRTMIVDMAEDDGLKENSALLYGWQGRGAFNGFRIDWCGTAVLNSYMEISDFMFFADLETAEAFSAALNHLNGVIHTARVTDPELEETTEDTRYNETQESVEIYEPWENETVTETETETLPVFEEETESQYVKDIDTEETVSESEAEDETHNAGDEDIDFEDESQNEVEEKSNMPFFVACISLSCLSVASIATVFVIRIKEKKANK